MSCSTLATTRFTTPDGRRPDGLVLVISQWSNMTERATESMQPICTAHAFTQRSKRKVNIEHWKVVATTSHTVSLIGVVGTDYVQTSPICYGRPGEVQTENTHYILGNKQPGMWEVQLQLNRPEQADNLRKHGVI